MRVRTKTLDLIAYTDLRVILMLTGHKGFQIVGHFKR